MKRSALLLALALGLSAWSAMAQQQDAPPPAGGPTPGFGRGPGGPPPGGPVGPGGFHLIPPRAVQQLNLTAEQQKQVADLEAETKAKLEQILTAEQLEQLKQMRPPMGRGPGMRGPRGPGWGGPPPGAPGGSGENAPQPPVPQQ